MDFNPNIHHGLHHDQKPIFLHHDHNNESVGGYLDPYHHHRQHPHDTTQLPMNMKQHIDPSNLETRRGAVPRQMYDYELEHNSPNLNDSFIPTPANPSSECSSPSPAPASAAAEYIRHQELHKSHPRKRIYQDWNQVAIFNTPSEAEEGIRNFENCRWKVGNKFTSREGFKVYWSCREGAGCPVQIHLLYHSQLPRVVLYRNQPDHHHAERVKTRGLPAQVESLIRKLFSEGVNKPRRIQFILQKEGMEEVPQTKLSNLLVKLRREAAVHGDGNQSKKSRGSYAYDEDEDEEDEAYGRDNSEEKSNHTMSSMSPSSAIFPSVIMSTPPGEDPNNSMPMNPNLNYHQQQHHHHSTAESPNPNFLGGPPYGVPQQMAGSSRYSNPGNFHSGGGGGACGSENSSSSFSHPMPFGGRGPDSVPPQSVAIKNENDADQSEVVTCSSSPTKTLVCVLDLLVILISNLYVFSARYVTISMIFPILMISYIFDVRKSQITKFYI